MNIKRYDFEVCEEYSDSCPGLFENANGEYVEYEDHKKAIETLARALDAACEELAEKLGCMTSTDCPWLDDHSVDCADCWRRYLLEIAEQERNEG